MSTKLAAHAVARAFLEALREPTDAMRKAMLEAQDAGPTGCWLELWHAGIDTALEEFGG